MAFSGQGVPLACSNILICWWFDCWGTKIQKVLERLEGNGQEKWNVDQQILIPKKIPQSCKQGGSWDQGDYRGINHQALVGAHQLSGWSSASFQLFWIISWSSEFVCSMAWCSFLVAGTYENCAHLWWTNKKVCFQETWKSKYLIFSSSCFLL